MTNSVTAASGHRRGEQRDPLGRAQPEVAGRRRAPPFVIVVIGRRSPCRAAGASRLLGSGRSTCRTVRQRCAKGRRSVRSELVTRGVTPRVRQVTAAGDPRARSGSAPSGVPSRAVPAVAREAVPGQAVPDQVMPDQAVPDQAVPGRRPGQAGPGHAVQSDRSRSDRPRHAGPVMPRELGLLSALFDDARVPLRAAGPVDLTGELAVDLHDVARTTSASRASRCPSSAPSSAPRPGVGAALAAARSIRPLPWAMASRRRQAAGGAHEQRLDLVRREVRTLLQQQRRGTGDDRRRLRRAAAAEQPLARARTPGSAASS